MVPEITHYVMGRTITLTYSPVAFCAKSTNVWLYWCITFELKLNHVTSDRNRPRHRLVNSWTSQLAKMFDGKLEYNRFTVYLKTAGTKGQDGASLPQLAATWRDQAVDGTAWQVTTGQLTYGTVQSQVWFKYDLLCYSWYYKCTWFLKIFRYV